MKFMFTLLLIGIIGFAVAQDAPAQSSSSDLNKRFGDQIKKNDGKLNKLWDNEANRIFKILDDVTNATGIDTQNIADFHKSVQSQLKNWRKAGENNVLGALGQGSVPE